LFWQRQTSLLQHGVLVVHVKRQFYCDASWHLRKQGLAFALYTKLGAITYDKMLATYGEYWSTGEKLAEFYDADENDVTAKLRWLAREGWLERVGDAPIYKPKDYRYVDHKEWAKSHPGKCFVSEAQVWDDEEHDELARSLHKHSFGKTYWYPNMLAGLRSSGLCDEEIVRAWKSYLVALPTKPNRRKLWKKTALEFTSKCKAGQFSGRILSELVVGPKG
jgi:hypothetical protein